MLNVGSIFRDIRIFNRILVPKTVYQRTIINIYENGRLVKKDITVRANTELEEVTCNPILNFFGLAMWISKGRYEPKEVWLEDVVIDKVKPYCK